MNVKSLQKACLIGLLCWPLLCAAVAAAPRPVLSVASVDELQAERGTAALLLLSYHAGTNRGGGLFVWDATANTAPDGCVVFAARGATAGRWIRQLTGALDATMCGVYWDNIHDDAAALTRAFAVASRLGAALDLPRGTAKVCSSVTAARAVIVRGQGMGTSNDSLPSPTLIDGSCMKGGWVFDLQTPNGTTNLEAPKYFDMEIRAGRNSNPGGCIRWNNAAGGFTDSAASQNYMLHPIAQRIFCSFHNAPGNQQIGLECSKCFDGDFSQNNVIYGKTAIALEGSDVMCIGCAGPNRVSYSIDSLIRLAAHGTFGNMNRVVANEILYPTDNRQRYDSFIYDGSRSSTIESNHIEGVISGVQSVIHVAGGFSHAIENNDIDVLADASGGIIKSAPHWLVADGPFVNFRATNNGCGACILGPALFRNNSPNYNDGGVRQIITHGGNAANGDVGFPANTGP